jgi:hypothetical protein
MKAESFTADTKGECQFWAKRREAELDRLALMSTLPALPAPLPVVVSARPWTVRELVEHYRRVVLPQQKAGKANGHHLDAMLRTADFADRSCYDIKRRDAVRWFDLRLAQVSPAAAVPRRSRERTHPCSRLWTLEVRSRECGGGSSTESTGGPRASRSDHESGAAMRGGCLWAPVDDTGTLDAVQQPGRETQCRTERAFGPPRQVIRSDVSEGRIVLGRIGLIETAGRLDVAEFVDQLRFIVSQD